MASTEKSAPQLETIVIWTIKPLQLWMSPFKHLAAVKQLDFVDTYIANFYLCHSGTSHFIFSLSWVFSEPLERGNTGKDAKPWICNISHAKTLAREIEYELSITFPSNCKFSSSLARPFIGYCLVPKVSTIRPYPTSSPLITSFLYHSTKTTWQATFPNMTASYSSASSIKPPPPTDSNQSRNIRHFTHHEIQDL